MLKFLLVVAFCAVACGGRTVRNPDPWIDAILQAEQDRHHVRQKREISFQNSSQICFDEDIGCFDWEETRFSGNFPENPGRQGLNVTYNLYSRDNNDTGVVMFYEDKNSFGNVEQLRKNDRPLFIIAHGFGGSHRTDWVVYMKNALLLAMDCNVIAVDWRKGAAFPLYNQGVANSLSVGRATAKIMADITQMYDYSPKMIHYIGFSMGAQMGGFAGRHYFKLTGTKFGRMTSLDPAAPGFEYYGMHVEKEDSDLTIVVHTSAGNNILTGKVGMVKPVGHIDFYMNGGGSQPGCAFYEVKCHHERAHKYFIESVLSTLSSNGCMFTALKCQESREEMSTYNRCSPIEAEVGMMALHPLGEGVMYIRTNPQMPFCYTA